MNFRTGRMALYLAVGSLLLSSNALAATVTYDWVPDPGSGGTGSMVITDAGIVDPANFGSRAAQPFVPDASLVSLTFTYPKNGLTFFLSDYNVAPYNPTGWTAVGGILQSFFERKGQSLDLRSLGVASITVSQGVTANGLNGLRPCCGGGLELEELAGHWQLGDNLLLEVDLDIRPGTFPNPINPGAAGLLPIAILGSDSFEAADIDASTLAFGPNGAAAAHRVGGHLEDVNGDDFTDLLIHYENRETGIGFGDTEACLTGELFDGSPLIGCDEVATGPSCGLGFELVFLLPPLIWAHGRRRRSIH
jgi:hypothetical protein